MYMTEDEKNERKKGIISKIKWFFIKLIILILLFISTIIYAENLKTMGKNYAVSNFGTIINMNFFNNEKSIESEIKDPRIAISNAFRYLGTPYLMGGKDSVAIDCSGLVYRAYKDVYGIKMTHAQGYAMITEKVAKKDIKPGDLIFMDKDPKDRAIDHVAIYLGNDMIIHAKGSRGVIVQSYTRDYKKATMKIGRIK